MTEQEALNDPEMKVIMLLSGYVRELGEGKDYETTTYKLAKTIVKVFSIDNFSKQRELLAAFAVWLSERDLKQEIDPEEWANIYLNNQCHNNETI